MKKNNLFLILPIYFLCSNLTYGQLSTLSDEFIGSTLDPSWNLFQTQFFDSPVPINNGSMYMASNDATCNPTCVWFQGDTAGFIYKNITGDFEVVTAVSALQKTNPTLDIANDTQLTGLLARDPASTSSGLENYVFNVAGIRFDTPSIELKSTLNNTSTIQAYTDNMSTGTKAELRMVRQGALFTLYSRPIGGSTWILRNSFDRPDLPTTLQVGMIAYTFESYSANLLAKFDYIRYGDIGTLSVTNPIKNQKVQISPNPVENELNIKIPNSIGNNTVSIYMYDPLGRTIDYKPKQQLNSNNSIKLDLSETNLSRGVYFLQIKSNGTNFGTYQFIKK